MLQAAIVEDEKEILTYLKNTMLHAFAEKQMHVAFDTFSSGSSFLNMFEEHYHYDMIFLDIEMPKIDGIEVCRRIRKIAPNSLVIFISSKEELVFQTFEVQPFRFVRKSRYEESLPSLIQAISDKLEQQKRHMIQITEPISGDVFSFDLQQILYVEAERKNCRIVTVNQEYILRCKLMDLEKLLLPHHFVKPHRCYLVNCGYIFYIKKTAIMLTNQIELPISRGKAEEIKQQFLQYSTLI